ncbi:Predicted integral membrane protein [Paracidovorax cattleyae]|uniref:Predicted integral membrane protein n=1 Tax=Paracidovorax cattleyae TaxID=80868 RepID=A0A1H0VW62_9BURK|nr:Predicted integral membrane protein [Paracidovorax cattleyae]
MPRNAGSPQIRWLTVLTGVMAPRAWCRPAHSRARAESALAQLPAMAPSRKARFQSMGLRTSWAPHCPPRAGPHVGGHGNRMQAHAFTRKVSMEYFVARWLHVLSSTVLFGTGIGTAFYLLVAVLGRDQPIAPACSPWDG